MCGIFVYRGKTYKISELLELFDKIKHRGPDASEIKKLDDNIVFGFHRLAIMDTSANGMQPMTKYDTITVVTNGEIYNWRNLEKELKVNLRSKCDTEIILDAYKKLGIERALQSFDGYFAMALYDSSTKELFIARDPYGVRLLYIGYTDNGEILVGSELKSVHKLSRTVAQFPPGYYARIVGDSPVELKQYHKYNFTTEITDEGAVLDNIRKLFVNAVHKRMSADRELGCLLSGGLDSSLVTATVQKILMSRRRRIKPSADPRMVDADSEPSAITDMMTKLKEQTVAWRERSLGNQFKESKMGKSADIKELKLLKTFSIGMTGSTDLEYAKKVADWIGCDHYEITIKPDEMIKAIDDIIRAIESYDVTTVRATVGNYLICSYIRNSTECRVIFNGDGSDELFGSYKYMSFAPSAEEFHKENIKLMRNIHYFDILREDKSTGGNGLEARSPFMDKDLIEYCMRLNPKLKMTDNEKMEKYILRRAFDKTGILPDEVLWRRKEAFSDGVSSADNSWHNILTQHFDKLISDQEFQTEIAKYNYNKPSTKEALYYRRVFEKEYPNRADIIPYKWLPNPDWFSNPVADPSARTLA